MTKKPPVQNAQKAFESSNRFSKTLIPLGVRMFNVHCSMFLVVIRPEDESIAERINNDGFVA